MTRINMADISKALSDEVKALNPELFSPTHINSSLSDDGRFRPAKEPRANKYGARRTEMDGIVFDSAKEARRYQVLKSMQDAGEISDLWLQSIITLMEGFIYRGKYIQPVRYTADFVYNKDGKMVIEDVKSVATAKTEAFRIRWRLLQHKYRDRDDVVLLLTE